MSELVLALDYGGTKLSAAITTPSARDWLDRARVQSPPAHDARCEQETMVALAHKLLDGHVPIAVGVSFGGPVDAQLGRVRLSHHIPGWEDFPLRDVLQTEFNAPVALDNDANVAALGEYTLGAGKGCASLLYVTVSTGVGAGWILNGRIFHGADSMAGEIGHTLVDPRGPACVCGRRGCVESLACGPAIAREARERLSERPGHTRTARESRLRAFTPDHLDQITAADVARGANEGDELAQEILDDAAYALGFGIGTAITLLNPERVVIGGGVSKSGERWWQVVRESARANSLPQMRVDILPAALGDDAPLWGAVVLAKSVSGEH